MSNELQNKFRQAIQSLHELESELYQDRELQSETESAFDIDIDIALIQQYVEMLEAMRGQYARRNMG